MKTVKIFMTVDGETIISSEYGTGKSYDLSSGTDLPWEGTYTISWDGKLASGQYPSDGEHTLNVSIGDDAHLKKIKKEIFVHIKNSYINFQRVV